MYRSIGTLIVVALFANTSMADQLLSLRLAELESLRNEPGAMSLIEQARAFDALSVASGQLPDPMLMIGASNLPTDTFNFDQEPMTQLRLAIKQAFPRGDSLDLRSSQARIRGERMRLLAQNRSLTVLQLTRQLWLDVLFAERADEIIAESVPLFEQLRDTTTSLYRVGKKGLDDVVRAKLELERLKDRQVSLREDIAKRRAMLARWVGYPAGSWAIEAGLPQWQIHVAEPDFDTLVNELIATHPGVQALDKTVEALDKEVALARQQYKPEWAVEAAYANRQARRASGETLPDLASVALTVSLPIFTKNRQDQTLIAAQRGLAAGRDSRLEYLRSVAAEWDAELRRHEKLVERVELHKTLILPQSREQAKASVIAYESDTSDFAEVMRASISYLDALLALERLEVDERKSLAMLRYLIPPDVDIRLIESVKPQGDLQG